MKSTGKHKNNVPQATKGIRPISGEPKFSFVDLFAGCGGLSLGLINAGWRGCFALEKNYDAFETLKTNLIVGVRGGYSWPDWLPQGAMPTSILLEKYKNELKEMNGKISLLAGGPPCQGFSMAGRRTHSDPRNALIEEYIEIVKHLKPRFLLIENVRGFTLPFRKNGKGDSKDIPYSTKVIQMLEKMGYKVFSELIDLSLYGVPQTRKRFIIIAVLADDPVCKKLKDKSPFDILRKNRRQFLVERGLPINKPVTVKEAIGDLEIVGKELIVCLDSKVGAYRQIRYNVGVNKSSFIRLMREGVLDAPDSLRLPQHKKNTIHKFQKIISTCIQGKTISKKDRERLGTKKHALVPLKGSLPSATITTLPDDMIHYSEPRILTVRENARIQTFPDWFRFAGKYTTGGKSRKNECPRYTQVGNAVPPLFSEAIGEVLKQLALEASVGNG